MTECLSAEKLLSAFLDGELAREEQQSVGAHLLQCAACRASLAELEKVRVLLQREAKPGMPDWLAGQIEQAGLAALPSRPLKGAWAIGAGVAVAAALAVFGIFWPQPERSVPISVFLAEHNRGYTRTLLMRRTAAAVADHQLDRAED